MITRGVLEEARRVALRKRVFFRVLDRLERGILTIASRVLDAASDSLLASQLELILTKISDATVSRFLRYVEQVGAMRLIKVLGYARAWGGSVDASWVAPDFSRYLAFLDFYQLNGWEVAR
jgi:hypothetical protein